MATTDLDRLVRAKSNYTRILLALTEVIANPTQATIDALVAAESTAGIVRPKPTASADGVSYDWTGYQQMVINQIEVLRKQIALESVWEIRGQMIT